MPNRLLLLNNLKSLLFSCKLGFVLQFLFCSILVFVLRLPGSLAHSGSFNIWFSFCLALILYSNIFLGYHYCLYSLASSLAFFFFLSAISQLPLHADWITHSPGYPTDPLNSSATSLDTRPCYTFTAGRGLIPWKHIIDSGKWNDSEEYRLSAEGERLGNQGVAENNLNIQKKVGITNRTRPWKRLRVRESAVHVEVSPWIE